jgi:hypothetical protein
MKRRFDLVMTMLLGCLVAAACSSGSGGSTGGLPTSPVSSDALTPIQMPMPIKEKALHPARRLRARVPGKLLSMPWKFVGVRRGGTVLIVYYVSGDGIHPHGVNNIGFRVVETSENVELIAVSRNDNPGPAQAGSLATGVTKIVLSDPLGTRTLLHAPTDSGWPADLLDG